MTCRQHASPDSIHVNSRLPLFFSPETSVCPVAEALPWREKNYKNRRICAPNQMRCDSLAQADVSEQARRTHLNSCQVPDCSCWCLGREYLNRTPPLPRPALAERSWPGQSCPIFQPFAGHHQEHRQDQPNMPSVDQFQPQRPPDVAIPSRLTNAPTDLILTEFGQPG